ncbi:MAG: GNAT family N-acetyltransferase [Anaeroplasmataceae bacterium]|nr:GNAT family N-acetyltransferase [Anaeroplasmataceae bacterium]
MNLQIKRYTKDKIQDVLDFEKRLREEENFWGWEINDSYIEAVKKSFEDSAFKDSISLLAYDGNIVIGRIDSTLIASHFDGSKKAYLDWICVIKSYRHQGVAQRMLEALRELLKNENIDTLIALTAANDEAQSFYKNIPNSIMRDIGIWIDVK